MSEHPFDPVEAFWDAIFSRDPYQIHAVYDPLDDQTQQSVIAHLVRMVTEANWHPEQVRSAQAALEALINANFPETGVTPPLAGLDRQAGSPHPGRKRHSPKTGKTGRE